MLLLSLVLLRMYSVVVGDVVNVKCKVDFIDLQAGSGFSVG